MYQQRAHFLIHILFLTGGLLTCQYREGVRPGLTDPSNPSKPTTLPTLPPSSHQFKYQVPT